MKKSTYLFALALGASTLTFAQVGIGTSTPSSPLDIQADDAAIDLNSEAADGSRDPKINFQLTGTTTFSIGLDDADSDKLKIGVGAPETSTRMTIDNAGLVGIGTVTPSTLLELWNGDATANAVENMFTITKETSGAAAAGIGAGMIFKIEDAGGAEEQASIDVFLEDVTNGAEDATMAFNINQNGTMTEVMRIDGTSGYVAIGTSSPSSNHVLSMKSVSGISGEVAGIKMINANNVDLEIGVTGHAYTAVGQSNAGLINVIDFQPLIFGTNNTERMRILQTGDVGIAMTNPSVELDVTGDIEYTGTITDVSDRRLKENFSSIDSVLTKIMKIKGLSYNMINDSLKTREYGVIAQDVQAVFPEMVTTVDPENGYLGVAYIQLIPVLLEATKEQQAIIEAQKKENESQKAELKTQKAEIESLKAEASNATSSSEENASEIEALKAQVQQMLQLLQQQESASVVK